MRKLIPYIIERLKESSTWRGIVLVATAAGAALTPDQQAAIVSAGMGIAGMIAVMFPDKRKRHE